MLCRHQVWHSTVLDADACPRDSVRVARAPICQHAKTNMLHSQYVHSPHPSGYLARRPRSSVVAGGFAAAREIEITKVALDEGGQVTAALWNTGPFSSREGTDGGEAVVSVQTVISAIREGFTVRARFPGIPRGLPERRFVEAERGWRGMTVVLDGPPVPGRELKDLYILFMEGA